MGNYWEWLLFDIFLLTLLYLLSLFLLFSIFLAKVMLIKDFMCDSQVPLKGRYTYWKTLPSLQVICLPKHFICTVVYFTVKNLLFDLFLVGTLYFISIFTLAVRKKKATLCKSSLLCKSSNKSAPIYELFLDDQAILTY